ncbi:phosphoenolpyruvate synthase [Thermopetrobacter sp. TC1]|uniref:phosphoenolpyruvate synthase n=1 Tax=Thermopetrobacter sp. TC1 TaxID=1495045 RepID=UPI000571D238|nr:phosphoenolpyruvate synthase [Thermopetrobacter sp. TC1]
MTNGQAALVRRLDEVGMDDVAEVGGKNASLGEMLRHLTKAGVRVPGGFATTAHAYRLFLKESGLDEKIARRLENLDVHDIAALRAAGSDIRGWIMQAPFPPALDKAIEQAWRAIPDADSASWAVRSSATAEDLPEASFAGQQETLLNVRGLENVKKAIHEVFASLFNDRAISYRVDKGFSHMDVALSAGVQRMVRSDLASSGVLFTIDTESGFKDVVFITGSYGLGEMVVQGAVGPDEFYVWKHGLEEGRPAILRRTLGAKEEKMVFAEDGEERVRIVPTSEEERRHFCLSDEEVMELARLGLAIEKHYGRPMDVEWAKDGIDGQLYIVQARPETVQSRKKVVEKFRLKEKGRVLASGRAVGSRIGVGRAKLLNSPDEMEAFEDGDVLITDMTDPDWEPIMKRAAAIVTNRGGRTCHAAIIARELGIPAVVGCGDATETVPDGIDVTVSCAEGEEGFVYEGRLAFEHEVHELEKMPEIPVKIMMNVGNPDRAFDFAQLPNEGVGLARLEFIINQMIGIHPKALLELETLDEKTRAEIEARIAPYGDPVDFFVKRLAEGVSTIAAAFWPKPVIVRMSDFKSNEYANLLGGQQFEPEEENPMIGFRGASRYISAFFRPCFDLECRAMRYVREEMALSNVKLMIPFVRTLKEATKVLEILKENGLDRGKNGLDVIMMCELPSNAVLADEFLKHFDGFSIGSNDMTQLTLGLDRDSGLVADAFDERDPAVLKMLDMAISACRRANKYVGICGQGPSDHPDFAVWLMQAGIESISLNPDTVVETWLNLAAQSANSGD